MIAFLNEFGSGRENCTELGLRNHRVGDVQTYSAVPHHRVDLVEGLAPLLDFLLVDSKLLCKLLPLLVSLRNELMERRVEETEGNRLAVHDFHRALHSCLDVRFKLGESSAALIVSLGKNHLTKLCKRSLGVLAVEHMLDTEQTDTLGAE